MSKRTGIKLNNQFIGIIDPFPLIKTPIAGVVGSSEKTKTKGHRYSVGGKSKNKEAVDVRENININP